MRRQAALDLPGVRAAPTAVRNFLAMHLGDWGLGSLVPDAQVLACELATNVVLHADTELRITLSVDGEFVEVAVTDGDSRRPVSQPARADLLAEVDAFPGLDTSRGDDLSHPGHPGPHLGEGGPLTGRGLLIVESLSDGWGVRERSDGAEGKQVWFRLRLPTA